MNDDNQPLPEQKTDLPNMPESSATPVEPLGFSASGDAPTDSPTPQPKSAHSSKMMMILVAILLVVASAAGGYFYGKSKAPATVDQTTTATEASLTVPQGATILSQCAVGRGTQYALPKDIPTGPVYNVYKGKVIGLEFMVGKDALFSGTNYLNLPMFGVKFNHVNIGLLSQGHAGFPVPHYHVDLFTVPNSVASAITCDSST